MDRAGYRSRTFIRTEGQQHGQGGLIHFHRVLRRHRLSRRTVLFPKGAKHRKPRHTTASGGWGGSGSLPGGLLTDPESIPWLSCCGGAVSSVTVGAIFLSTSQGLSAPGMKNPSSADTYSGVTPSRLCRRGASWLYNLPGGFADAVAMTTAVAGGASSPCVDTMIPEHSNRRTILWLIAVWVFLSHTCSKRAVINRPYAVWYSIEATRYPYCALEIEGINVLPNSNLLDLAVLLRYSG